MKKVLFTMLLAVMLISVTACGKKEDEQKTSYQIYYLQPDALKLESSQYDIDAISDSDIVNRLITLISLEYADNQVNVLDVSIEGDIVRVNFDNGYNSLDLAEKVLVRTALVKTLTQVPSINGVSIAVQGVDITDSNGKKLGVLRDEEYLLSDSESELPNQNDIVNIYFLDKSGDEIYSVAREITYSGNESLEYAVVKSVIDGPFKEEKMKPVCNKNTVINSVHRVDKVCYVDLTEEFSDVPGHVSIDQSISAIKNSVMNVDGIDEVIILINGELLEKGN